MRGIVCCEWASASAAALLDPMAMLALVAIGALRPSAEWSFVWPQTQPVTGGDAFPSVRYSASGVIYQGELVISHGYFYDHGNHHPAWQSNAWVFNLASRAWRKVHEGERAGAPSARYCSSAVVFEHAMWMYGGDDGGHKTSMNNYIFGAYFDELWRLDLRTYVWRKVTPRAGAIPPKRALHGAVEVGGSMYVYGGLGLADTWRYDFLTKEWTQLVAAPAEGDATHPGRRHAFSMAAAPDGFYMFGGNRHNKGSKPSNFNDLWKFSAPSNAWSEVRPAGELPGARGHASLLALSAATLLLYGGALCTPGCKCYGDTWLFDAPSATWSFLNASDAPIHRYRQTTLLDPASGAVYLFGGESYKPYMYHNAVNRLSIAMPSHALVEVADPAAAGAAGGAREGARRHGAGAHERRKHGAPGEKSTR